MTIFSQFGNDGGMRCSSTFVMIISSKTLTFGKCIPARVSKLHRDVKINYEYIVSKGLICYF